VVATSVVVVEVGTLVALDVLVVDDVAAGVLPPPHAAARGLKTSIR
jgi:hypothetical protein